MNLTERTHGNVSTYRAGCRCDQCRRASTIARREERRRTTVDPRTDAAAAMSHVIELRAAGMTLGQIARQAGTTKSVISNLSRGVVATIRESANSRLLAVEIPKVVTEPDPRWALTGGEWVYVDGIARWKESA